jgi:hypothetical protein
MSDWPSCGNCVRYDKGPRRGQLFMRCLRCAVIAVNAADARRREEADKQARRLASPPVTGL